VSYVIDAWAVLRMLEATHPAARRVAALVGRERVTMSWINAGEVFYTVRRLHGEPAALTVLSELRPAVRFEVPTEPRVLDAARLKDDHGLGYADAFAAATAVAHDAVLLTGDGDLLRPDAPWQWEDLRRPPPRRR
jgi:predicted nucleic acid-binding protein